MISRTVHFFKPLLVSLLKTQDSGVYVCYGLINFWELGTIQLLISLSHENITNKKKSRATYLVLGD